MAGELIDSSEYTGYRLIIFVSVFTAISMVVVAMRFYARSLTSAKYNAGDWLIVAALVGQIVAAGLAIGAVKQAGVGRHVAHLAKTNPEAITLFLKYLVAISTWYATTEGLAKLSICLLYKSIFPRKTHIILNMTILILIGASVGGGLADLFGCVPFSMHWGTPEQQATHCINVEMLFVWGSFPNIVTDVILLVIPLPIVWNLKASVRMRIVLLATFLVGSMGLITSIIRFIAFYNKSSFIDSNFSAVELIIWTVCEPGVYLIAACLLMCRPLLEKLGFPLVVSASSRHRAQANRQNKKTYLASDGTALVPLGHSQSELREEQMTV